MSVEPFFSQSSSLSVHLSVHPGLIGGVMLRLEEVDLRWIWGEFPYVRLSVHALVPPPKAQSSNPAHWGLNSSLLSLKSSLTENSPLRLSQKALLYTTEAWNQALLSKQMDVWMDVCKFTPVFTEHWYFEATALLSPQDLGTATKQGNGYCWPYEILGWLAFYVHLSVCSTPLPSSLWGPILAFSLPKSALKPKISPLRPHISLLWPQISSLRPQISPLRPQITQPFQAWISPPKPSICPFRLQICPLKQRNQAFQALHQPSHAFNHLSWLLGQRSQRGQSPV